MSSTSRPDPISCLKIARGLKEDPVIILRLSGHASVAELIEWFIPGRRVDKGFEVRNPQHARLHRKIQQIIEEDEAGGYLEAVKSIVKIWEKNRDQEPRNRLAK